jgi:hypothetical protein
MCFEIKIAEQYCSTILKQIIMKTFFTLLASLFVTVGVMAANVYNASKITVSSSGKEDLRVVVNGKRFETTGNQITIDNLKAGSHTIKVYREKNTGYYNILGKRYEMVYDSRININNKTHVNISIDRNGRTTMKETVLKGNGRGYGRDHDRTYDYDDGHSGDYPVYVESRGMSNYEFERVVKNIAAEWRESNKIKSATQVVKSNSLTSTQVAQLVSLFNIESYKLELAKVAYTNTVDKKYYDYVLAHLSKASKTELTRYIRNYR